MASSPITLVNRWGKTGSSDRLYFLGSKITADGDCSHEIKRCLCLGRKAMTNLSSILKNRDITLPTKVCIVKAMVFPVVIYGCASWTIKKAECWRIDAFRLWWRRLLRVLWTARRSNQSTLKEINPEYSFEGLMLKLKYQNFGHLLQIANSLEKTLMLGKIEGRRRMTEDKMVGWYHWLKGHESEQAPGDGEGQGSLACCNPWGHKESDMTEWLVKQQGLQQSMNCKFPDVQVGFRKGWRTRDQTTNIHWITGKKRGIPEKYLLLFHWIHESFWLYWLRQTGKFLILNLGLPDHLNCLLRNLYGSQGTTVSNNVEQLNG